MWFKNIGPSNSGLINYRRRRRFFDKLLTMLNFTSAQRDPQTVQMLFFYEIEPLKKSMDQVRPANRTKKYLLLRNYNFQKSTQGSDFTRKRL
jgi:hypothetical protein